MLALSPPLFSTFGWPLEDPIGYELNNGCWERETSDSLMDSHFYRTPQESPESGFIGGGGGTAMVVKKLNHNANERDRRKRINNLYSSLFSLLPEGDQSKKLSIPATVSRVVKYIPELQKEVQRLAQTKEDLSSKIFRQQDLVRPEKRRKYTDDSSLSVVSTSPLGDREAVIQISTVKVNNCSLSEALKTLEEEGILLINGSSFQPSGDRVIHNLHIQVQGNTKLEYHELREKLLSMYEKREDLFLQTPVSF